MLDEALYRLPSSDQDVVLMRLASGLSLNQIDRPLGKSESAEQRRLQRVVGNLASILRRRVVTTFALFLGTDFAKAVPTTLSISADSKAAITSAATTSGIPLYTDAAQRGNMTHAEYWAVVDSHQDAVLPDFGDLMDPAGPVLKDPPLVANLGAILDDDQLTTFEKIRNRAGSRPPGQARRRQGACRR